MSCGIIGAVKSDVKSSGAGIGGALPFRIDRAATKSLVDQMVDGVKAAVASGRYGPGARLPSVRAMADLAGVSLIVPRLAIQRLEREEIVVTRPRIGTIVRAPETKIWRGRVLFVVPESDGNFMINVTTGTMRNELAVRGYHLERVTVPKRPDGKYDFTFFDLSTKIKADLVLVAYRRPSVIRRMQTLGVPFVVMGGIAEGPVKGAVGMVGMSSRAAAQELVRRCQANGLRRVMRVGFSIEKSDCLSRLVRGAGLEYESWTVRHRGDARRHDLVAVSACSAFERRLASGVEWLPDVFYFDDDFVASGALMSLAHRGVRVPGDVRVVSFANLGLGPVFYRRLTTFECDSFAYGKAVASALIRFLESGRWPGDIVFGERYVPGETFP